MTATVEFVIERAENALQVANTALRVQPTAEMAAGVTSAGRPRADGATATLWFVAAHGTVRAVAVRTGLTDGQATVVEGAELEEGMQVIAAVVGGTASSGAAAPNPFQSQQRQGGPGRF
jgi:multidrug efflux pump subunit AcrA (membrane-fusion protein)